MKEYLTQFFEDSARLVEALGCLNYPRISDACIASNIALLSHLNQLPEEVVEQIMQYTFQPPPPTSTKPLSFHFGKQEVLLRHFRTISQFWLHFRVYQSFMVVKQQLGKQPAKNHYQRCKLFLLKKCNHLPLTFEDKQYFTYQHYWTWLIQIAKQLYNTLPRDFWQAQLTQVLDFEEDELAQTKLDTQMDCNVEKFQWPDELYVRNQWLNMEQVINCSNEQNSHTFTLFNFENQFNCFTYDEQEMMPPPSLIVLLRQLFAYYTHLSPESHDEKDPWASMLLLQTSVRLTHAWLDILIYLTILTLYPVSRSQPSCSFNEIGAIMTPIEHTFLESVYQTMGLMLMQMPTGLLKFGRNIFTRYLGHELLQTFCVVEDAEMDIPEMVAGCFPEFFKYEQHVLLTRHSQQLRHNLASVQLRHVTVQQSLANIPVDQLLPSSQYIFVMPSRLYFNADWEPIPFDKCLTAKYHMQMFLIEPHRRRRFTSYCLQNYYTSIRWRTASGQDYWALFDYLGMVRDAQKNCRPMALIQNPQYWPRYVVDLTGHQWYFDFQQTHTYCVDHRQVLLASHFINQFYAYPAQQKKKPHILKRSYQDLASGVHVKPLLCLQTELYKHPETFGAFMYGFCLRVGCHVMRVFKKHARQVDSQPLYFNCLCLLTRTPNPSLQTSLFFAYLYEQLPKEISKTLTNYFTKYLLTFDFKPNRHFESYMKLIFSDPVWHSFVRQPVPRQLREHQEILFW